MSLVLHGHHVLLIATLAFVAAVLTPNWFTSLNNGIKINVFQICTNSSPLQSCPWTLTLPSNNPFAGEIKIIYPILIASFALACAGVSLIGLLIGSSYIQQHTSDNDSRCLLVLTSLATLASFLFSCGVWTIMLTTNFQQVFGISDIRLQEFGFSFWINIGASSGYLYAFFIYLIAICKN